MESTVMPSPGEVLQESFLKPNGITPYRLAKAMGKQQSLLTAILGGTRGITAETAYLLGKVLGTSAEYWMDVDTRYQLSKLDTSDMPDVERIIDGQEEEMSFYESDGWVVSDGSRNNARLGEAVVGAMIAASEINEGRDDLLKSINDYAVLRIVSVPGSESYHEYKEDVSLGAIGIYEQFLIAAGEDPDDVKHVVHEQRCKMYQEAGKTDIDGFGRPQNWRRAKSVNLKYVGELMCMASDLDDDARQQVFDCLFEYAHNEAVTLPEDMDARRVFNRFLVHCEGCNGLIEELGMTPGEYFNENSEWSRGM